MRIIVDLPDDLGAGVQAADLNASAIARPGRRRPRPRPIGHDEAECSLALLLVADVRAELNRIWEMAGLEGSPFPTTDAS